MFKEIKEKVNILDGFEKYLDMSMVPCGEDTFEPEDKTCPFCEHRDCFKIKSSEEFSCWSCFSDCQISGGDLVDFVKRYHDVSISEAARTIAEDFGIAVSSVKRNPKQEVMDLAGSYYHNQLLENETSTIAKDGVKYSPLNYQLEVRKHDKRTLEYLKVGWSDGGLVEYLTSIGIDLKVIEGAGLMNKKGNDYIAGGRFVYPHIVHNKVSSFTLKSPDPKDKVYQFRKVNRLNEVVLYNQNSATRAKATIIIVEGENDVASVLDDGWSEGIVGTCGTIDTHQLSFLKKHVVDKHVITLFDADGAGDKYRSKANELAPFAAVMQHIKVPVEFNDIDAYLKKGNTLEDANRDFEVTVDLTGGQRSLALLPPTANLHMDTLRKQAKKPEAMKDVKEGSNVDIESENQKTVTVEEDGSFDDDAGSGSRKITEAEGCYLKTRYSNGEPQVVAITNFVIVINNIFIRGNNERTREIQIISKNGQTSRPLSVSSADKVSLKSFKTLLANAADASFYGTENDLINIWEYVYAKGSPRFVIIPDMVGSIAEFNGWLFDDCFINVQGEVFSPDKGGVMWADTTGHSKTQQRGIKGRDINDSECSSASIPRLNNMFGKDDYEDLLEGFVANLAQNLGNPGMALTMIAWAQANAYSDDIFDVWRCFPFLFMWGRHGQGKTNLVKWVLATYDMEEKGYTTIANLKTAVGFERKAAYYASLPLAIDEVRADKNTSMHYGRFRSWYNRAPRTMGTREGSNVKVVPVRSNFIFSGQDIFTDDALADRCISLQLPKGGRELRDSYSWIEGRIDDLSAIGYNWILEAKGTDFKEVEEGMKDVGTMLKATPASSRSRIQWGIIGYFALKLRDKYLPDFNYESYLKTTVTLEAKSNTENDALSIFFTHVEGMCAGERPDIHSDHVKVEDDVMYIWFMEMVNLVSRRTVHDNREAFTYNALRAAILEEGWCLGSGIKRLGHRNTQRRVIQIDLKHKTVPFSLTSIAESLTS